MIKATVLHYFYDVTLTMSQIDSYCLSECISYLQNYCGGVVWSEIETTAQVLPKYVDTTYGINVWFDAVTESFLFEDFN